MKARNMSMGRLVARMGKASGDSLLPDDAKAALVILCTGFAPITALALALMEICSLPCATMLLVVPSIVVAGTVLGRGRGYGWLMLRGFMMGMVAVTVYDAVRIPFTMAGWIGDFIPTIGVMLVGEGALHGVVGYLWRYLGNGGGMGMAFVCVFVLLKEHFPVLRLFGVMKSAVVFGFLVWACLIGTLLLSPRGEEILFVIHPVTLLISGVGHGVFGVTLGLLLRKFPLNR
jgi:hypothetical protein